MGGRSPSNTKIQSNLLESLTEPTLRNYGATAGCEKALTRDVNQKIHQFLQVTFGASCPSTHTEEFERPVLFVAMLAILSAAKNQDHSIAADRDLCTQHAPGGDASQHQQRNHEH